MKHKTAKDEQFPVKQLVPASLRPLVDTYYQAAREADDIADNPCLQQDEKLRRLAAVREAFLQPSAADDRPEIRRLGKLFVAENLDASLFLDLLTAFERDAAGRPVRIWEELMDYCRYSAAPVGRFILAVHDEAPSAILPAEQLCIVLQMINHLGDIKQDLSQLGRCYIPQDMMQKYGVRPSDFGLNYTSSAVRELLDEMLSRTGAMLKEAALLPALIRNFRLRFNICVILSLTNSMLQKYKRADFLQNPPRPNMTDRLKAFCLGMIKALRNRPEGQGRVL